LLLAFAALAHALIGMAFPLSAMVEESEWIVVAKVEKIDPQAPLVVLSVSEDLKGHVRNFVAHNEVARDGIIDNLAGKAKLPMLPSHHRGARPSRKK
jgi:hypothetical protein